MTNYNPFISQLMIKVLIINNGVIKDFNPNFYYIVIILDI
jgi:hypothetical protein